MSAIDVPNGALRRRVRLLARVARQAKPRLAVVIVSTLILSSLAGALQSFAMKKIIDSAVERNWTTAAVAAAVVGVAAGLLGTAGRAMSDTETVVTNQVGVLIDHNTLELTANMPGIEHLERPEYLDQIALLRTGGASLMRAVFALTATASLGISMLAALWLLAAVHPLLVLVPLFAIPAAILVPRSQRFVDGAALEASERQRAATQLHRLFLNPAAAMELRVFRAAPQLDRRSDAMWREVSDIQFRGALRAAAMSSLGWISLTLGYLGALLFTAHRATRGQATPGDVVLVSQLALQIRGSVSETARAAQQAAAALRTTDRFLWLEDVASAHAQRYGGNVVAPAVIEHGITIDNLDFTYPGLHEPTLQSVNAFFPAGSTVAIVGDNGAGKTTLVKVLTGMYQPTGGAILVDDTSLGDLDIASWRRRSAGTFQDFVRLESQVRASVGVGAPGGVDDDPRVMSALERGNATDVVAVLDGGLDAHLGKSFADGHELSGGQWQRLAIARGMMPDTPLLLVLDEPTAALDPAAEQALFDQYRSTAREVGERGAITLLISHRFSSVRMADLIVVLAGGTVVETGTHEALVALEGTYARMYRQQADAYS